MNRSSKKLLTVIVSAVFAVGTALGYYGPGAFHANGGAAIQDQHSQAITVLRDDVRAMRILLDALIVKTSGAESKLDMLVGIVRDHAQEGRK